MFIDYLDTPLGLFEFMATEQGIRQAIFCGDKVSGDKKVESKTNEITALCKLSGKTGVEMEALTGVNVALLTLFDMCKAIDPGMHMEGVRVLEKKGGKTGHWQSDRQQA